MLAPGAAVPVHAAHCPFFPAASASRERRRRLREPLQRRSWIGRRLVRTSFGAASAFRSAGRRLQPVQRIRTIRVRRGSRIRRRLEMITSIFCASAVRRKGRGMEPLCHRSRKRVRWSRKRRRLVVRSSREDLLRRDEGRHPLPTRGRSLRGTLGSISLVHHLLLMKAVVLRFGRRAPAVSGAHRGGRER